MNLKVKRCDICGDGFLPRSGRQIHCPRCAELMKRYRERETVEKLIPPLAERIAERGRHCKGCGYWRSMDGVRAYACHYLLYTGHRRPCPAGEFCEVRCEHPSESEIEAYKLRRLQVHED